ncbi:MAG TPA: tRNA (adenosine(37)-N6)-dimethylallyltransferase MiaA [Anaerolineae bacterium]|nr:tRNA (adenosine(37)-N6)-dimethylallyltransferase MiaA [Anaerolineae bacterium]HID84305.1 tRNA (adenosine(37)-N6)-dimethylallyltransferase MiaA [Anaerolineales bacterium]HIQ09158.1 tRNA (adenosine(37)-N6)-dimethylallyltransferase MiaA [Anaerolineaceae bacterium]
MRQQQPSSRGVASAPGHPRRPLLVLVGPTAVGKTALSLALAERLNAEIVSADSRLLYRGMDIGTAKPTLEERHRVPHHLIDVAQPDEVWTVARYQEAAYRAIDAIQRRGRLPMLVGGTGQYVWAVVEGWLVPRVPPLPGLREALERWGREIGPEALHARLARLDPVAASRILPSNLRRTVRALEVIFATGRRFSEQQGKRPPPYDILIVGLMRPRAELHQRIRQRIMAMLEAGWLDEVRRLLAAGYAPGLPAMSGIGYAELAAHLRGEFTLEEAVERIRRRTQIFLRRQANWFKASDTRIHWFPMGPGTRDEVLDLVRRWLRGEVPSLREGVLPSGSGE